MFCGVLLWADRSVGRGRAARAANILSGSLPVVAAATMITSGASAIAKRVATVEELLGTALFARGTKPLQLTPSGREYLQQVKGALQLLAAMPLHRRAVQRSQRLRVLAPPTFARQILVPRLASFSAAHAQIELELQLSVPYAEPATAQADVEVRYGEVDAAAPQVLLCEQVLPLAAPALLARLPPLRRPADLARAPLLRTPLQPWTPWFRAAGLDWPEPAEGPKLLDLGLTLEAAVSGQGIALARPALARPWLAAGSLLFYALLFWLMRPVSARLIEGLRLQIDNERMAQQLRENLERKAHEAATDALTGLANRRSLDQLLDAWLKRPPTQQGLAVLMLDIDHFKSVNDRHGHAVGDATLKAFAERVRADFVHGSILHRRGGDAYDISLSRAAYGQQVQASPVAVTALMASVAMVTPLILNTTLPRLNTRWRGKARRSNPMGCAAVIVALRGEFTSVRDPCTNAFRLQLTLG